VPIDDKLASQLISGLDSLVFSIDTSDPETFERLRLGANLNAVMANLRTVLEKKRSWGLKREDKPVVYVNAVMTSETFPQFPGLVRMLEPLASQLLYLMVDPVTRADYQHFEPPFVTQRERFAYLLPEYREIEKKSSLQIMGLDWMFEPSLYWRDCIMPWNSMFLEPNGDVYSCYHYARIFGNVWHDDPLAIWNSPEANRFRQELKTGGAPLRQCETCNFARRGWQTGGKYLRDKKDGY
jgi:radical SAM protein with 4Fe4S-binding SPASM domain